MKLRASKGLPGSSLQLANSAGQSLDRVMLSLRRAAHTIPHSRSVMDSLAEPAGCRVLSCCPLVVLENVGSSQFPLLSRAESEEGDFSRTGQPVQEATSLTLAGCCGAGSAAAKLVSAASFFPLQEGSYEIQPCGGLSLSLGWDLSSSFSSQL